MMKRYPYIFFVLVMLLKPTLGRDLEQTRALWITRWEYQTPDDIRKIVQNAAVAHFNLLLFQVRGNATVNYPSKIEPWTEEFNMKDPGWDPLKTAIESAHAYNMELHAWINVYPAWRGSTPPQNPDQLYNTHPSWIMRDVLGRLQRLNSNYVWLSPTHPDVQNYLLDICREIYQNYAVDGLHLDYIRYPGNTFSYDTESLDLYNKLTGSDPFAAVDEWSQWRRDAITSFITRLHDAMVAYNPGLVLSAAVVQDYATGYRVFLQDSHAWLAKGVIDIIFPMLYTPDNVLFRRQLEEHRLNDHGRFVYPGIYARTNQQIQEQIAIVEDMGCKGVSLFSYSALFPDHQASEIETESLGKLWQEDVPRSEYTWKKTPEKDRQGPVIVEVKTIPTDLYANSEFKIAARIVDTSGVYDDATGSDGQGLYLVYDRNWPPNEGVQIKMSPMNGTRDWFVTDQAIPPQKQGLDFRCRIFAWDNYHDDSGQPMRHLGYSEIWSLSILLPDKAYVSSGIIGPVLESPTAIEVDRLGKIWISSSEEQSVRIYNTDNTELPFSPLKTGLDQQGNPLPIHSPVALSFLSPDIMCVASDQDPPMIFRFNVKTGQPLNGIATGFKIGKIDCDNEGHIYALENGNTLWHILTLGGVELEGSPFGSKQIANDIAVLDHGELVFVSDRSGNTVQCWRGRIDGLKAFYKRGKDIPTVDIGLGKIAVSHSDHVYVAHSQRGIVSIFNKSGKPLGYLAGGTPPLIAPVEIAMTAKGDTLYVLESAGSGPTRLSVWVQKKKK
jgi:uncharacterized lipoprotein YddW (UPF0748 family)